MRISFFFIFLLWFSNCFCQQPEKKYNKKYIVGTTPELKMFLIPDAYDLSRDSFNKMKGILLDSLHPENDSFALAYEKQYNYLENRSRIYFTSYVNGEVLKPKSKYNYNPKKEYELLIHEEDTFLVIDEEIVNKKDIREDEDRLRKENENFAKMSYIPWTCNCRLDDNILNVQMFLGFFGGIGFPIQISDGEFKSFYVASADGSEIYKANKEDKLSDDLAIDNKYQKLILTSEPDFKHGGKIAGYLEFTTNNFYMSEYDYEKDKEELNENYLTGKIYFMCNYLPDDYWKK